MAKTTEEVEDFFIKIPASKLKRIKQLDKTVKAMDKLWTKGQKVKK